MAYGAYLPVSHPPACLTPFIPHYLGPLASCLQMADSGTLSGKARVCSCAQVETFFVSSSKSCVAFDGRQHLYCTRGQIWPLYKIAIVSHQQHYKVLLDSLKILPVSTVNRAGAQSEAIGHVCPGMSVGGWCRRKLCRRTQEH